MVGFGPEDLRDAAEIAKYYISKGIDWPSKLLEDLGPEFESEIPKVWAMINKKEETKSPVKAQEDPAPLGPVVSYAAKGQLTVPDVIVSRKMQRITFWTVIIVIGMCIYPPWLLFENTKSSREGVIHKLPIPSKYSFIWESPEEGGGSKSISATIDIRRLIVQCFIVLLMGGCLIFNCLRKDELVADKQNNNQEMVIINKNLLNKTAENTDTKTEKLHIICPQCHKRLFGATKAWVGDTGVCPKCKAEFIIEEKKH